MPSIAIFTGVIVLFLFAVLIWINVKFSKASVRTEIRETNMAHDVQIDMQNEAQNDPYPVVIAKELDTEPLLVQDSNCSYIVIDESVPVFAQDNWKRIFEKLTNESDVAGWIAFQNTTVGAYNRFYDADFLDILQMHQKSLSRLRKEVGLSSVQHSLVHGREGDIWLIYADEEIWLALFTAGDGNIHDLTNVIYQELSPHI